MNRPIRYAINPLAAKSSIWLAEPWQLIGGFKNPSYLNSVWLGCGLNLLNIPQRIFQAIVKPLFNFQLRPLLVGLLAMPIATVLGIYQGLMGRLMALPLTKEEVVYGTVLDHQQASEALEQGCDLVVLDMMLLVAQQQGVLPEGTVIPGFPPGWDDGLKA